MKRFKKALVINVPQDDHNEISSPTHISYKETKQRPLILYNENTVPSSANNQDQLNQQDDRQLVNCQEFVQFNGKNQFQQKHFDKNQTVELGNKNHKYKKINVIEFEEFSIDNDKSKNQNNNKNSQFDKRENKNNHKRQFSIQIPDNQERDQKHQTGSKFSYDMKNQTSNKYVKQNNFVKQPPGPSNKLKLSKTLNRQFVFPTNDQQNLKQTVMKKQKGSIKYISEQDYQRKIRELNNEWNEKEQNLKKLFEKERQQFYKQKSNLQKDLMIKDGQIQMLQKLITNRYSPKQSNSSFQQYNTSDKQSYGKQSYNKQPPKYQSYKMQYNKNNQKLSKSNLYVSDQKISSMETILLEKDLNINSLLQKINDLNIIIDKKNSQIQQLKINILKNQKLNQSLRNQLFIYEKKQQSQKLTKNFYKMKQTLIQVQQSSKTPKGYSRNKWSQQIQIQKSKIQKEKPKSPQKNQYAPLRGIDDLHKRLQSLKMNRIQLQNRGRIKSQLNYPQTSKNKTKGTFDFKGKFYDRDRDYINQTRMY